MRKFFFGATATRAFSSATAKRSTLGIGVIVCLTAFFAFGLKTGVSSLGATAQRQIKVDAKSTNTSAKVAATPAKPATLATTHGTKPANHAAVLQQYAKLPLSFEPNLGQANGDAKFLARGEGYSLFLTSNEAVLAMAGHSTKSTQPAAKSAHSTGVLRMELLGSNPAPNFSAQDELPGKSNYFIGDQKNWRSNVPNYGKVAEKNIYPGIDLVYYGTQRQLEYDFNVAPGADPKAIQISFEGARKLRVDAAGNLILGLAGGEVKFEKPFAYQMKGDVKEPVTARFHLGDRKYRIYFAVDNYDATRPLVIDPILAYSTYLGGSNIDGANAIAVASDNTAFVTGGTFSLDFPTAHPLQANDGGDKDFPQDAFVAKLSADGSTLLYSTYLGGSNEDVAYGIAVDTAGDAYVTGKTNSKDFPVTIDAVNVECGGDGQCGASFNSGGLIVTNGFLTKLNPAGSAIIYSTYIGFYENVICFAVAVDQNQNAYVTGSVTANIQPTVTITPPATPPPPFPITTGIGFGGGTTDAFLIKINSTGNSVLYSTYVGGSAEDDGYGVAVTKTSGLAYLTGLTLSANFPTTAGAFQPGFGGQGDAFFTQINTNVQAPGSLVYSTFFGGSGLDQGNGIAIDAIGNAYIVGGTASTGLGSGLGPADCVPVQLSCQGDAFVAEFNPAGSGAGSLVFFTYLGGSLNDSASGVALDPNRNIYVTGSTVSPDFPTAAAAFQTSFGGGNDDAFVAKIDGTTHTLDYSSYLGGTDTDNGNGIAVDTSGSAYVAGQTCSTNFPVSNAEQVTPGGNCDAFISKVSILNGIQLNPSALVFPAQSLNTTSAPEAVTLTNGDNPLTISSITLGGTNPGDFAISGTSTCAAGSALNPGVQCTIIATFSPTASGVRKATITLTDSAPDSPQVISLTGTTSTLTLSASSLDFGSVPLGSTSAPQGVIATNNGTTALTFSSITASGDFAESDDCTAAPLQPTTNCTITVTFTPSSTASSVGALTLTDNAPGSPQIVLLTGSGFVQTQDFSIGSITPSGTIVAGGTATYTVVLSSIAGFNQPVSLSCTGLPKETSCSFPVNPVTPTPAGAAATVNISTAERTMAPPSGQIRIAPPARLIRNINVLWSTCLLILLLFGMWTAGTQRGRRAAATLVFAAGLILFSVACNGGGSTGAQAGTPAGTYTINVVASSANGTITHSTPVTLQVK